MNIPDYIKKNRDMFLVGLLILILVCFQYGGRMKEGFESTVANSVSTIEQKFNQAFSTITDKDVEMLQNLKLKGALNVTKEINASEDIKTTGGQLRTKNASITEAGHLYLGGRIKQVNGDKKASLDAEEIKKMKSRLDLGGYAVDGQATTHLLFEDGWQNLNSGTYAAWANDAWDIIYLFKGWKIEVAEHGNGKGWKKTFENKDKKIQRFQLPGNQASSFNLTWVSY